MFVLKKKVFDIFRIYLDEKVCQRKQCLIFSDIQINPSGPNLLVGLGNKQILDCFVSSDQTTATIGYTWKYPAGANVEM